MFFDQYRSEFRVSSHFSIINLLIFIALLRLSNAYYYLSQAFGLETEINATGGNAFNFSNYLALGLIALVLFAKLPKYSLKVKTAWIYAVLIGLYLINAFFAPYVNTQWILYQLAFLTVALTVHFITINRRTVRGCINLRNLWPVYLAGMVFLGFCLWTILESVSLTYYLQEYNDAFVQTMNEYGVMKQRFGYLAGFLLSYSLFVLKDQRLKIAAVALILFCCFGIRSFVIGLSISALLFQLRKPRLLLMTILGISAVYLIFLQSYFELFIYDTRYYSFLNLIHIVKNFGFGLGLGGYPIYTEEFGRILFAEFQNVEAILQFIPTAPESDLVHVLASLGLVFGTVHLLIQSSLVYFTVKFLPLFNSYDKCILFYFSFMSFYGISEDSIFSINYWIFFGLSSGIIYSKLISRGES